MLREQAAGGQVVFSDDFETNRGWTPNPNGTDTASTGRWERGDPEATSSDGVKQLGTTTSGVNDLVTGRLAGLPRARTTSTAGSLPSSPRPSPCPRVGV